MNINTIANIVQILYIVVFLNPNSIAILFAIQSAKVNFNNARVSLFIIAPLCLFCFLICLVILCLSLFLFPYNVNILLVLWAVLHRLNICNS